MTFSKLIFLFCKKALILKFRKFKKEMVEKGITQDAIAKVQPLFTMQGDANQQLESLKVMLGSSKIGMQGIQELDFIVSTIS